MKIFFRCGQALVKALYLFILSLKDLRHMVLFVQGHIRLSVVHAYFIQNDFLNNHK